MSLSCPYGYKFNIKSRIPIELSCNHMLCLSYFEHLKVYKYPQLCPFDS